MEDNGDSAPADGGRTATGEIPLRRPRLRPTSSYQAPEPLTRPNLPVAPPPYPTVPPTRPVGGPVSAPPQAGPPTQTAGPSTPTVGPATPTAGPPTVRMTPPVAPPAAPSDPGTPQPAAAPNGAQPTRSEPAPAAETPAPASRREARSTAAGSVGGGATPFEFGLQSRRPRPRTTALEWISFVLAFIAPPIGLLLAIGNRIAAFRNLRWMTAVAKAATPIALVFTLALGAGVGFFLEFTRSAAEHAELVRKTVPLCNFAEHYPGVLEDPTFGWPPVAESIPASVSAIEAFRTEWAYLARVLPAPIRADAASIATAADTILAEIESNRFIDAPKNIERVSLVVGRSGIPAWVSEYCG